MPAADWSVRGKEWLLAVETCGDGCTRDRSREARDHVALEILFDARVQNIILVEVKHRGAIYRLLSRIICLNNLALYTLQMRTQYLVFFNTNHGALVSTGIS
jgi:hypothetical protein